MKKVLAIMLALVMVFAMGSMAFAADEEPAAGSTAATAYGLDAAKMTKELTVADGINIDAVKTFTFSFTAGSTDTAETADHPTIADQTITVGTQSNGKATGEKALSDIFTISSFPHAGEYVYTVVETTAAINTTADGITKTLTVDSTQYKVRVYVVNGENGLEFKGVTVAKVSGETEEKVDPTADGFIFKNTYTEVIENTEGVLTVTKTITGDYADKTKTFPVTVELVIPTTATADDVAVASGTITGTAPNLSVTADLTNNGEIKFTKLPAGTTYTVKETQDSLYQSKTTGAVASADTAYVTGNVEKAGAAPITAAGVTVSIENNREDVVPTGVIIRNLPYVALVLVAVLGFVYLTIKKRSYNK